MSAETRRQARQQELRRRYTAHEARIRDVLAYRERNGSFVWKLERATVQEPIYLPVNIERPGPEFVRIKYNTSDRWVAIQAGMWDEYQPELKSIDDAVRAGWIDAGSDSYWEPFILPDRQRLHGDGAYNRQ